MLTDLKGPWWTGREISQFAKIHSDMIVGTPSNAIRSAIIGQFNDDPIERYHRLNLQIANNR